MQTSDAESMPALATFFDLLSDETRLRIVVALAAADPDPLRFSDLRHRVGADDAGRFNYHLSRLRTTLVEKTDEGYVLTATGRRVVDDLFEAASDA